MSATEGIHEAAGGSVVNDLEILSGTVVFQGTHIPVASLFECIAEGLSLDHFLETFQPATREQPIGVLRYGQHRIEEEQAA